MTVTPEEAQLAVRAAVAHRFQVNGPTLTRQLTQTLIDRSPELRGADTALASLVKALARTLVNETAVGLVDLNGHDDIAGVAGGTALARQLGERGVPAHRALAVYLVAQHWLLDTVLLELRAVSADGEADLFPPVVDWIMRLFGALTQAAGREHANTQDLWRSSNGTILAHDVALVLEEIEDVAEASDLLDYRLDTRHVGVVAWSRSGRLDARRISRIVRQLTQLTLVADALIAPRDSVSVVAWLAIPGPARGLAAHVTRQLGTATDLRLAFGEPLPGLAGFRETHRQALAAHNVAQLAGSLDDAWVRFRDIAPTCLLSGSPDQAELFVERVLGDLGCAGEETTRLRETLRVYLENGENASRAAAKLHVHRNTVNYRVAGAIDLLGVPFEQNRLSVGLALNYRRHAMGGSDRTVKATDD